MLNVNEKKILVYCGVHNGDGLAGECKGYDIIYGFDANIEKINKAKERFQTNLKQQFYFFNYALSEKDNEELEFNVFENWDASSSIGDINPEYGHFKNENGVLYKTPIKKVKVKTINLGNFLKSKGIKKIDRIVTDLQGYDLSVVKTLTEFIQNHKIGQLKCEVEWNDTPPIYINSPSNKLSDFENFFGEKYKKVWHLPNSEDWWETDIEFAINRDNEAVNK
jgi:FkbM family methyltransferase